MYIPLAWKPIVSFNITALFIAALHVRIHAYFLGLPSLSLTEDEVIFQVLTLFWA